MHVQAINGSPYSMMSEKLTKGGYILTVLGKIALITGAGSGIGRATAMLLSREGAKVCLVDINEKRTTETADHIHKAGGECIAYIADVSNESEISRAIHFAVDHFDGLDIVFANAGINGVVAPIEEIEPKEWDATINTNLKGTFLCTKYAIPHLRARGGGSIVVTSSINGNRVFSSAGYSVYSTSKSAQVAFTKMAALELSQFHIRVNAVCPGATKTHISESTHRRNIKDVEIPIVFPKGDQPLEDGPASAEQIAKLVLFLADDQASGHITGTEIYIDGAESLLHG